jgi:hypothetical protein
MRRIAILVALVGSALPTYGQSEEQFKQCVQVKELVLLIAKQADAGMTREEIKSRASARSFEQLINWVFDFSGRIQQSRISRQAIRHLHSAFSEAVGCA